MATGPAADEHVVVRDDDPRRASFERDGWELVARSWGARLVDPQVAPLRALVDKLGGSLRVEELTAGVAPQIHGLLAAERDDFPTTPATPVPDWDTSAIEAFWSDGGTVVGVFDGDRLVAVTTLRVSGVRGETEWTVVAASHRGRGIGSAVKAASVLAALRIGATTFATGGAGVNVASIRMNEAVGYRLTETWLTFRPPAAAGGGAPLP